MDEPIEGGGSFDGTGAFLGADDRFTGDKTRMSDTSQANMHTMSDKGDKKSDTTNVSNAGDKDNPAGDDSETVRTNEKEDGNKPSVIDGRPNESVHKVEMNTNKREKELRAGETDVKKASDEKHLAKHITGSSSYKNSSRPVSREMAPVSAQSEKLSNTSAMSSTPIDRLQEVAEDIEKLIMDDDQPCNESDDALLASHLHGRDSHKHPNADDVLAEKKKEIDRWYYRDPQGKVQGPFTATEMLEWYRAGYFDETLNVRRVCDPQFIELGELLKACSGSIPFVSMPPPQIIPPLLQSSANEIKMSTAPNVKPSTPTKPLANHLVHSGKMPPPSSTNQPPYYDILQSQNFLGLMNPPSNDFRKYCNVNTICQVFSLEKWYTLSINTRSPFGLMKEFFPFFVQFYQIHCLSIKIRPSIHCKIR